MINTEILKQSFHSKSQEDMIRDYQSDPEKGLTPEEAALRLEALGRNAISEEKKKSLWLIFLSQFTNVLNTSNKSSLLQHYKHCTDFGKFA